jgi:hypothetical protein
MFVCARGTRAIDIITPAPSSEVANLVHATESAALREPPKIATPAPAAVGKPQEVATSVVKFTRRSPAKPSVEIAGPEQATATDGPSEPLKNCECGAGGSRGASPNLEILTTVRVQPRKTIAVSKIELPLGP